MISLYNVCSILCYFIKVGIFFNQTFELQSSRTYVGAGGLLNKSNSFLNELAQDIFGQSIITHKPYEFDANNIRGTVLCLCNGNTKNIPTSEFGFFLQIQIPYEDVSDFFRLQFVFEAKMSGDVMGNMFWRVIWNDKPCLWTQMSIASLP